MENALAAERLSIAMVHLELARKHRQERHQLIAESAARVRPYASGRINGTDKEG